MTTHYYTCRCVDCGKGFEAKATHAKRCKDCAGEWERERRRQYRREHAEIKRRNYTPRKQTMMTCLCCGQETIRNSGNQKYCPVCSADAMYRRQIELKKRRDAIARGEVVVAKVGDTIKCVDCGAELIKKNARHVRCAECAEKHRIAKNKDYWQLRKASNEAEKRRKAETPKYKSLSDIVAEARRLGLSYGQYATLLHNGTLGQYCLTHNVSTKGA